MKTIEQVKHELIQNWQRDWDKILTEWIQEVLQEAAENAETTVVCRYYSGDCDDMYERVEVSEDSILNVINKLR